MPWWTSWCGSLIGMVSWYSLPFSSLSHYGQGNRSSVWLFQEMSIWSVHTVPTQIMKIVGHINIFHLETLRYVTHLHKHLEYLHCPVSCSCIWIYNKFGEIRILFHNFKSNIKIMHLFISTQYDNNCSSYFYIRSTVSNNTWSSKVN